MKRLKRNYPSCATRYVEPFAGSASLFFSIEPQAALLSDLNDELITTYRALKRDPTLVLQCLRRLPLGRDAYYRIRSTSVAYAADAEVAARFLYLNRYCFNGLYRTNQRGEFNVPYGPPKTPLLDFESTVLNAARALRCAELRAQDFERTIAEVQAGDFVYLDPPYAVDDRRVFREYLPGSFTRVDIPRLTASLERIDRVGGVFLLSYAYSREARQVAEKWFHRRVVARRNVAGFACDRRKALELLVSNRPILGTSG